MLTLVRGMASNEASSRPVEIRWRFPASDGHSDHSLILPRPKSDDHLHFSAISMLNKAAVLLALTGGLLSAAGAADNPLERELADQYRDKVLALRHSFPSRSQEYTVDGAPVNAGDERSWTLYGRVVVNKIKVRPDRLEIEGKRALFFFDKSGSLTQFHDDRKHPAEPLTIVLRLQQPLTSAQDAAAALGRVFALTPEDIVSSTPAYWQQQLERLLGLPSRKNAGSADAVGAAEKGSSENETVFDLADPEVRKHFSPPKLLSQREPDYSDAARARRFQGVVGLKVVIDKTGRVRNVVIVHPLGMGLDDNAVATVSKWLFSPATRDGQPVAMSVHVEVDFHLY